MKHLVILILLVMTLGLFPESFAEESPTIPSTEHEFSSPEEFVKIKTEVISKLVEQKEVDYDESMKLMNQMFDYKSMARYTLGPQNLRNMNKEIENSPEKKEYLQNVMEKFFEEYRLFLFYTYAPKIKSLKGYKFTMNGFQQSGPAKHGLFKVYVNLSKSNAEYSNKNMDLHLTYRVKYSEQEKTYKIIDVRVENISLVETQQAEFYDVVSSGKTVIKGIEELTKILVDTNSKIKF